MKMVVTEGRFHVSLTAAKEERRVGRLEWTAGTVELTAVTAATRERRKLGRKKRALSLRRPRASARDSCQT